MSEWSTDLFADAANLLASDAGDVVSAGCPTELKVIFLFIFVVYFNQYCSNVSSDFRSIH